MAPINSQVVRCSLSVLLLLLVGCSPAGRTRPDDDDLSQRLSEAGRLLEQGQHMRAAEELIQITGQFPDHAPAWTLLARAFLQLNQPDVAAMVGERAFRLAPNDRDAQFYTGLAYGLRDSHPDRAVARLEAALRLGEPRAGYALGGVYEQTGKPEEAAEIYRRALVTFPSDPDLIRAQAAIAGDLNMDGKPEQIRVQATTMIVTDGATGGELLRWSDPTADPSETWTASVVDLGGESPALLAAGPHRASVFIWQKGGLVGSPAIENRLDYRPVARVAVAAKMGEDRSYLSAWAIQEGELRKIRQWEEPFDPPASPPAGLVELFMAANRLQAHAFTVPELHSEVLARLKTADPGQVRAAFLLPDAAGTYRLELDVEGRTTATATVTLSTVDGMQIQELKWR